MLTFALYCSNVAASQSCICAVVCCKDAVDILLLLDSLELHTAVTTTGGRCHPSCMNFGQLNCWGSGADQCQKREFISSKPYSKCVYVAVAGMHLRM